MLVWTPVIGKELEVKTEEDNNHDHHTVAVVKDILFIAQRPYLVTKVCWFFVKRGGNMLDNWKRKVWSWFRSALYMYVCIFYRAYYNMLPTINFHASNGKVKQNIAQLAVFGVHYLVLLMNFY